MNLAVLVTDYLTYEFEAGALHYYPLCAACDRDSLPFDIDLVVPGDFGSIAFTYTETGDTLLFGTIIWMGSGKLSQPDDFELAEKFGELTAAAPDPISSELFNIYPLLDPAEFESKADSAWARVERLDIVWDFAAGDYRVGVYLYAPSVGVFEPAAAKWIIFLYRGNSSEE